MKKNVISIIWVLLYIGANAQTEGFVTDKFSTKNGDLTITFIGHASLMFEFQGKIIHIDPFSKVGDYSKLPKADLILLTHQHRDHLDTVAMRLIVKPETDIWVSESCLPGLQGWQKVNTIKNNLDFTWNNIKVEAHPAYNIVNKRETGEAYHPFGEGNSYILNFSNIRLLVGGDTENTPEIKAMKDIDVAFLPMNLPYTMTPEMVADAAKAFKPKVLYPYHYSSTNTQLLVDLMKDEKKVEVRIRKM